MKLIDERERASAARPGQRAACGRGTDPAQGWALVLAAGDGTRVSALTRGRDGVVVPKQFCRCGDSTLLAAALARAAAIAPPVRTVVVVAAQHRRWWQRELGRLPASNVVVQPRNRGTAVGVLLPLLAAGGSWNSFVAAARVETLLELYRAKLPVLERVLAGAVGAGAPGALDAAYASLVPADFSRDLLQGSEERLRLVPVPPCGWDDLATPERLSLRGVRLVPPADETVDEARPRRAPAARYSSPRALVAAPAVHPLRRVQE